MVRAVKHWRHHPCKSLGGSSAYYQYHDTRILKFKQSEIIKKNFWRIRLKNIAGFPYIETQQSYLNVSEAELIHKQLLCIFFFPSSSVTPYMKYLFERDRQGIHWKSEKGWIRHLVRGGNLVRQKTIYLFMSVAKWHFVYAHSKGI